MISTLKIPIELPAVLTKPHANGISKYTKHEYISKGNTESC